MYLRYNAAIVNMQILYGIWPHWDSHKKKWMGVLARNSEKEPQSKKDGDPVLWAWLGTFYTPKMLPIPKQQIISSVLLYLFWLNVVKDTTKAPAVDPLED